MLFALMGCLSSCWFLESVVAVSAFRFLKIVFFILVIAALISSLVVGMVFVFQFQIGYVALRSSNFLDSSSVFVFSIRPKVWVARVHNSFFFLLSLLLLDGWVSTNESPDGVWPEGRLPITLESFTQVMLEAFRLNY